MIRRRFAALTLALVGLTACGAQQATGGPGGPDPQKVWVCKYVGTPFVNERLQTGNNPISVSVNAIPLPDVQIGSEFADRQGRSVVIAFDTGQDRPDRGECPPPTGTTTTTADDGGSTTTTTDDGATTTTTDDSGTTTTTDGSTTTTDDGGATTTTDAPTAPVTTTTTPGTPSATTTTAPTVTPAATPSTLDDLPVTR